jgi:hexosaminidase
MVIPTRAFGLDLSTCRETKSQSKTTNSSTEHVAFQYFLLFFRCGHLYSLIESIALLFLEAQKTMRSPLYWNKEKVTNELQKLLNSLGDEFPILEGENNNGQRLDFCFVEEGQGLKVSQEESRTTIYHNTLSEAARGVGSALAQIEESSTTPFRSLGIMLDCSRNAVMKVDHLKKWLRRMALMGYNLLMLYTEDTYLLPDEPYFGYLRGAYSLEEIKDLDAYASTLGIEMIGCIQALGHMEKTLRWPAYKDIRDTNGVMMVDQEETYTLIGKMMDFWSEALGNRRLHIGMDETFGLGTGNFLKQKGQEDPSLIYSRHLSKVTEQCHARGLKPMIWSDMVFNLKGGAENSNLEASEDSNALKSSLPKGLDLAHWDYYHEDKESYQKMLKSHRELGYEPMMASGVWTWSRLWYDHEQTVATVTPCIEACIEVGVKDLFFTMWGDGGAYCEYDSALAGLLWSANLAHGNPDDESQLSKRFGAICDMNYEATLLISGIQGKGTGYHKKPQADDPLEIHAPRLLFEDPLFGQYFDSKETSYWEEVIARYQNINHQLEEHSSIGPIIHGKNILTLLISILKFSSEIRRAYQAQDHDALNIVKENLLPNVLQAYLRFSESLRSQWMLRNKVEGFEFVQNKVNVSIGRFEETNRLLTDYLSGAIDEIPGLSFQPQRLP